jgi:hypothetical protein
MTKVDDVARSLNTVGLAAWFGGSLMGAVALRNVDTSAPRGDGTPTIEAENEVWRRWSPVQSAAIGAYLLGSAKLTTTNKGRIAGQRGVAKVAFVKAACTAGALGATYYASKLGKQVHREVERSSTDGSAATGVEQSMKRLRMAQAAVPLLTGTMLVADARLGEQQRPMQVLRGMAARAVPDSLQSLPDMLHAGPALGAVTGAAKHFPEAMQMLPEAAKHLPEAAKHLPEAARAMASR